MTVSTAYSSAAAAQAAAVRHIPSLDGLRAVSILIVFLSHVGLERFIPGGFGVTVFFFLSGFLITTLMRSEFEKNGSVSLKHFWLRRALRILPPFYLVLLVAVFASLFGGTGDQLAAPAVAAQALHYTNYWIIWHGYDGLPSGAGTGVYWSLAVEEHFYVLFPWLYLAMRRYRLSGRAQAAVLLVLCAIVLLWRYVLVTHFQVPLDRTYMGTDTRVDSILFGCALAVGFNPVLDPLPLHERRWKYCFVPLALCVLAATLLYREATFRETLRYTLQGLALAPLFVAAIRFSQWLPFQFLNWRPIAFLGVVSYSFYLVHFGMIFFVQRHAPALHPAAQAIAAFAGAFATSWLIYILIEKPCGRLRRRLID